VEKDTLLGRVDDQQAAIAVRVAQTQYDVARKEAENDISVRAAQAAAEVAESEYQEALEANQQVRGTVTPAEVRRLLLTHRRSLLQIELAQLEYDVTRQSVAIRAAELEAAQQALARRRIEAPLAGVVAQVHRRQGEWLDPGAPVVRIVRMDALRVEGFMSTAQWAPYELIDRPVSVAVQLTRGRVEQFASRVAFVSPLVEASGEFRVWCEIENRRENGQWLVNPGMRAEMAIAPNR
jgi:multidrug efflux pump subunit AcrA (membrane-fusion protein)